MHENRETSGVSRSDRDRSEKALSRTADMYVAEESDQAIVPVNHRTKRGNLRRRLGREGRGAVCVSSASTDLRGGCRVTGIPTAISFPADLTHVVGLLRLSHFSRPRNLFLGNRDQDAERSAAPSVRDLFLMSSPA